jgi:glucose-6-phosphate isomerase
MHGKKIRQWMEASLDSNSVSQRTFAVTSNVEKAAALNVPINQVLYLPHWVGGRYSLWSPVSLAAAAVGGPEAFRLLLKGAAGMDRHFTQAPLEENLPVLMGLLGVWHRNICGYASWGVIPYDQRLRLLPAHLQQLIMESNGKSVSFSGEAVTQHTAPLVFGETGTDAQHSLFQSLHQGSEKVPLNLVGVISPDHGDADAHAELLANMLAQATALATGRSDIETRKLMESEGLTIDDAMVNQRSFEGNRPSEILLLDNLGPENLGKLLALYEHKVFVESVIWGINAFDQWGVELGKSLAPSIRDVLQGRESADPALAGLMSYIKDRSQGG